MFLLLFTIDLKFLADNQTNSGVVFADHALCYSGFSGFSELPSSVFVKVTMKEG